MDTNNDSLINDFSEFEPGDMIAPMNEILDEDCKDRYPDLWTSAQRFSKICGYRTFVGGDEEMFEEIDDYILLLISMLHHSKKKMKGKIVSVQDNGEFWIFKLKINNHECVVNYAHKELSWLNYEFIDQINASLTNIYDGKFMRIELGGKGTEGLGQTFIICYLTSDEIIEINNINERYLINR